jgi:serine/threonine protein phosphatase PrpC
MRQYVFGESVQGASHKRTGVECQDSIGKIECDDGTLILAVADGHGSKSCPYSKTGSKIAVNVFCSVMKKFHDGYKDNIEMLLTYLNREGDTKVAQAVDSEWKRRVLKVHANNKREVPLLEDGEKNKQEIWRQYGSTLVGLMITPVFLFAFQLGDGDISYIDDNGFDQVLHTEKILGTETHSLSKIDSWKRAISAVRRRDSNSDTQFAFLLSTDGFANSYKNEAEFIKTCMDYYSMLKEHGAEAVNDNLKAWLTETSEMGCGDDITLLIAFFSDDAKSDIPLDTATPTPILDAPIESEAISVEQSE